MRCGGLLKLALCCLLIGFACAAAGCFSWTEDSQGRLTSAGLPGVPLWQSQPNAAEAQPLRPVDMGMTPDEAARMSGPVLVQPPSTASKVWRYRYYLTGQNHCQDDLAKLTAARAQTGETGQAPYCTDNPTTPPIKGNAFIF